MRLSDTPIAPGENSCALQRDLQQIPSIPDPITAEAPRVPSGENATDYAYVRSWKGPVMSSKVLQ